jgi:hypothetical protein
MADEAKKKPDEQEEQDDDAQASGTAQPGDATGAANGGENNGGNDERRLTQADVDRIVGERLERARAKWERDKQKVDEEADADRLAEQEKWQELAEKHSKRAKELEAESETLQAALEEAQKQTKRVEGALGAYLETAREGLPEHILALLDKLDVVDQLAWLAENRAAIAEEDGKKGKAPIPGTPKPDDGKAVTEQQRQDAQAQTARRYRNQF